MALVLASCGGGSGKSSSSTEPTASTTVTTGAPQTTTASTATTTTTVPDFATTTTAAPCPNAAGSTAPVTTGKRQVPALLNSVGVTSALCVDLVRLGFTTKADAAPSCTVSYQNGPFTADASGAAVSVAGNAFVVVKCAPAYGYDFDTGTPTYTGAARITANGTRFVRELVETGDFEGVLTWVIGLGEKRPFRVVAAAMPQGTSYASTLLI
jgi:hypothetical protein